MAYALVALALAQQAKPQAKQFEWVGVFIALTASIYLVERWGNRSLANLRKSMMGATEGEEEIKVRRYLRSVAFALFFAGTVCQMIEITLF